jgi:hypothetical protein
MHRKRSFVLRLYVDSRTPDVLTGDLQALPYRRVHSFKSNAAWTDLLTQLAKPHSKHLLADDALEAGDLCQHSQDDPNP